MRYQINRYSLVHVTPLGVMIKFFGHVGNPRHEGERLNEVSKDEVLMQLPILNRPGSLQGMSH